MTICIPILPPGKRQRLSVLMLPLALASCQNADRDTAQQRASLVRLADDDAKSIDPQSASDLATMRIASEQFEGLTRLDASGKPEPGLARSWSVSKDGLRWTFTLVARARFSDGTPITPEIFVKVHKRLTAPEAASPVMALFAAIKAVRAQTPDQVVIDLHHPSPDLPELLAHPALAALPLHRTNWSSERPVTASGAYRVTRWDLSDQIVLDRNPAWHGGAPPIARVIWKPVSDGLTALRSFEGGEADIASEFPASRLKSIKARMPQAVRIAPYRGTYYFAFNTKTAPFNDQRVRQALSMAVDRDWLAHQLIATGIQPAYGVIPPPGSASRPDWSTWPMAQRIAHARGLLAKAGYGANTPLRFTIRFNSDPDHRRTAVALAAMWKPLGVHAQLLNTEASLHFASLRRGDFELARSGWIGDVSSPENFLAVHSSHGGAVNYSGYANPKFDSRLALALAEPVASARAQAMRDAEAILQADAPILPLWFYVSKSVVSERVGGWQDNPANAHPSRTLWLKR